MKHIIKYLGALLAVVFIGTTFTACSEDDAESANVGLGIKTFFPTKVVTNQPITINGSNFDAVTEIEFPGGQKVSNFEIVSNDMIRVNAPSGIAADGGKIVVRTSNDQAESKQSLTIGHTNVTGFDRQPGETVKGGELITVFGSDLEFINGVELLDADGEPQLVDHKDFYRKGTNEVKILVPQMNIYKGTFVGYLHTYDGKKIEMPELSYEPGAAGGHWETVRTTIWKNNGTEAISWNGIYRFGLEGHDDNNECITTFPEDVWNIIKTGTFYMKYSAPDPTQYQIRVTNGWWDVQWMGADNDIAPWNMAERIIDNGDGTFSIEVNFGDDPLVETLDQKHLLFTGSGYTPLEIYTEEEVWVEGEGGDQEVKTTVWKNDGSAGAISWSGTYRFGLDGNDGNNECIATFPEDVWNRIKTGTFYMKYSAPDPTQYQVRVTNGWWDTQWMGADNDIAPWNMSERIIDNGDGTFYIEINFGDDPIVETLDQKHLLFTGSGYTVEEIYFIDIIKGGGGGGAKEDVFWQNSGAGAVSWNGIYRFALEGHDGASECIAEFPQEIWDKIKTSTFYLTVEATDPQIRVTNGWWDVQWQSDFQPGNELLTDNGDGTWTLEINIAGDPLVDTIDQKHILFTGDRFTPVKLFFK